MKKFMLALLAAGTMATANAQEGSILLYGNAGVLSNTTQDVSAAPKYNTFNWNVNPGIGYQINKNWTVGLNLGYGQNTHKSADSSNNRFSQNNYSVGVFGRYTCMMGDSKTFFWYGQVDVSYAGQYYTDGDAPAFGKASGISANIFPAIAANIGHQCALNFSIGGLGYESMNGTGDNTSKSSTFDFTIGKQVNIGLSKNFGGHIHGHHSMGDDTRESNMSDDNDDSSNGGKHHHHHKKAADKDKDGDE